MSKQANIMGCKSKYWLVFICVFSLILLCTSAQADGETGEENASNPLAKVKNTDLRWQYLDMENGHVNDFFIDGAFMANDKLKIKYELHYWETDITGNSEHDLESVTLNSMFKFLYGQAIRQIGRQPAELGISNRLNPLTFSLAGTL